VAVWGAALVVAVEVVWPPRLVAPVAVACGTLVAAVEVVADLDLLLPQPASSAAPASATANQVDGVRIIGGS
jgi:hypothetical protein